MINPLRSTHAIIGSLTAALLALSSLPIIGVPSAIATSRPVISLSQSSSTQVKVRWRGGKANGTIKVAANKAFSQFKQSKKAKKRAATIQLPKALAAGSGRQIYLRVTAGKTSKIVWTILTKSRPSGATLSVASYNTCLSCSSKSKNSWAHRKSRVAASIKRANADVIGIQEATTANSRFADIRDSVSSAGYALAYDDDVVYHPDDYASPDRISAADGYSRNAQLLYKPSKLTLVDGGVLSPAELDGAPSVLKNSRNANYRKWFAWAKFTQQSTGRQFIVISIHYPVGTSGAAQSIRNAVQSTVNAWLNRVAYGWPVVWMGDFNSTYERESNGVPAQMSNNYGFQEAASAPGRSLTNLRFSTSNRNVSNTKYDGFPPSVFRAAYAGQRIDYIFAKNIRGFSTYSTQVVTTKGLKFDQRYQGSDHNLIKASLVL